MVYRDYHLHTEYSFDSSEKMKNICQKAITCNVGELCFTEHVEFGIDDAGEWPDFEKRDKELYELKKKYGENIKLLRGVEVGQAIKDEAGEKELFRKHNFDFVIASMHVVGDYGRPSKYDFSVDDSYIRYFKDYFKEIKILAEKCEYDVLGHLTFPFRYATSEILAKYPIEGYKNDFMELLEIVIKRDKGIEVNTSGLRMPVLNETLPNINILKWYKELGGKIITVGSDGHSERNAFSGIEEGYRILSEVGFREVCLFEKRRINTICLTN